MDITYFEGCTLKTQAKELDKYARLSAGALGINMVDIPDWQCCGGTYPMATDEIATKLSSVRALDYAKHNGGVLLTLCSACYNVIKRVNDDMKNNPEINSRVNNYMALPEKYNGETKVIHYIEMLRDYVGFDKISKAVKNPLNKKVGAYYGCLLLRPSSILKFDNPENPTVIENLISALGGTPVKYPFRNECCGAYVKLKNPSLAESKSEKVIESALASGVETLITACPLCYYNLKQVANGRIEIKYVSETLAEALSVKE